MDLMKKIRSKLISDGCHGFYTSWIRGFIWDLQIFPVLNAEKIADWAHTWRMKNFRQIFVMFALWNYSDIGEILGFVGKILDVKDFSTSGKPLTMIWGMIWWPNPSYLNEIPLVLCFFLPNSLSETTFISAKSLDLLEKFWMWKICHTMENL